MNMVSSGFRHLVLRIIVGLSPNIKGPLERSILALAATANLLSIGVRFRDGRSHSIVIFNGFHVGSVRHITPFTIS